MSQTPGDTLNLCETSPADLAGSIDNILTQLVNMETIVARMLGWDLSVLQLSDLSQDAGLLQSVTQIFNNDTGVVQGMSYDTTLAMPQDGRTYYPVFNCELVDGVLVYKIVQWVPSSGSGSPSGSITDYFECTYINGVVVAERHSGTAIDAQPEYWPWYWGDGIWGNIYTREAGYYIAGVYTYHKRAAGAGEPSTIFSGMTNFGDDWESIAETRFLAASDLYGPTFWDAGAVAITFGFHDVGWNIPIRARAFENPETGGGYPSFIRVWCVKLA